MSDYGYTDRDLLERRETYFYSTLGGAGWLAVYREARRTALSHLPKGTLLPFGTGGPLPDGSGPIRTADLLDSLEASPDPEWIDRLVQRFEVTKRLYESYDARLRKGSGPFRDLSLYARLARLLATDPARLDWLNALLKLHDLLLSQPTEALQSVNGTLRETVECELAAIEQLERRHA
ncbi:hypothetical protein [Jannaschia donghaensis]|uniref:Uncharacterized protein n=1 Tax=Jannaschia donghaensis TaxID=420998 RepID=A0A0M6YGR7_9RHOB|nr:hypothetical protein [Jannaschia donghaensis]CTQ48875.1 hypothetical protein JDO7802_00883 [Jannaschia donghaensis]